MTVKDLFKKLGINIDDDVVIDEGTKDDNKDGKDTKTNNKDTKEKTDDKENNKDNPKNKPSDEIYNSDGRDKEVQKLDIKFDDKTGLFNLEGIEDESVKEVLTRANNYTITTRNNVAIDRAFNDKLSTLKLRKGITTDLVKKVIDLSNVKVDNDKVSGIDEAFEILQKEQSGLFIQKNQPESNPNLEGFNPTDDGTNSNKTGLDAALAGLAASLTSAE